MNAKSLRSTKALLAGGILAVAGLPAYGQDIRSPQQQDSLLNKLTSIVNVQSQLIQQLQDQLQQKGTVKTTSRQGVTTEVIVGRINAPAVVPSRIPLQTAQLYADGANTGRIRIIRDPLSVTEESGSIAYKSLIPPHTTLPIPGFGEIVVWCFKSGEFDLYPPNNRLGEYNLSSEPSFPNVVAIYGFRNASSNSLAYSGSSGFGNGQSLINSLLPKDFVVVTTGATDNSTNFITGAATIDIVNPSFNRGFKSARIWINELSQIPSTLNPFFATVEGLDSNTCGGVVTATITSEAS